MEEKETKRRDPVARFLLALLRGAFLLGLLFYLLYHLTGGFSAEMKTQTVKPVTEEELLFAVGTVVRDEEPIFSETGGVVSYHVPDGEKVGKNAKIAMVYSGYAESETVARIAELDRSIDLMEEAGIDGNTSVSDGTKARREIESRLLRLSDGIGRGDFSSVAEERGKLHALLLRRDAILTEDGEGARATLAALRAERESLAATLAGSSAAVRTAVPGYFYSYADGGEKLFEYADILTLTPEGYANTLSALQSTPTEAIGKIVLLARWYLVCPVSLEEAKGLDAGRAYDLLFADGMRLSMTLAAKNEDKESALLIFSTLQMPEGFAFDRTQKVSIVTDTVSGYKLPSSALRIVDGKVGVYIRSGNTVKFRFVDILKEEDAYVFVRTDTEGGTLYAEDADTTNDVYCKGLSLYDNVIVGGARELFPDRIVN